MAEGDVTNDTNDVLEIRYYQSHHPIKNNMENKQIDEIEELSEIRNCNNPVIGPHRG